MTDVIHSKVSSADLTSATIVIEGTTLKISIIIHATANGGLPANARTAPISWHPNNLSDREIFPHPGPFADCVTENSLEKTATHTI